MRPVLPFSKNAPVWPLNETEPVFTYLQHILCMKPCGLCTDIDGTISAIAPTVDAAVLLPGMQDLLIKATTKFDLVATISGRGVADQRRMINIPNVWHVGHHGYEWEEQNSTTLERTIALYPGVEPYIKEVAAALDEIEQTLFPLIPGLWMERKGITGGVHWRLAPDWKQAEQIAYPIITTIAEQHGLICKGGKLAIELYPPIATNKGEGLSYLVETHKLKSVLYFGDDISDIDAFQEVQQMRKQGICAGLAIGVSHEGVPKNLAESADFMVGNPVEVMHLFQWLLTALKAL